ncbi:MAG: NapC/NirT family cytochrome c [Bryobacterales bacterium]|nr:NapC/NirT family cytochrome c [Bryobacterales bacterium]
MNPETPGTRFDALLTPLIRLSRNWVSRAGVFIVTAVAVFFIFLLPTMFSGAVSHPYLGILSFVVLPGIFVFGLVLIPLGLYLDRRRGGPQVLEPSERSWSNPMLRRLVMFIGVTTVVNIIIFSQLTYRAVHFMDSTAFCGTTCHTVMQPEFASYQNSPHSRVDCVQCHIGPGAAWEVKAKISGIRQVFKVLFNTYSRPTPAPVHDLRPAQDTCEGCHWPQKFATDRVRVISKYADDEANSVTKSVLLMRIGGGHLRKGIHGTHLEKGVTIRYRPADSKRQTVPWVELTREGEAPTVYLANGAKAEDMNKLELRTMDCIDCHNRPTHTYDMPESGVDRALAEGRISDTLPFAKKTSLELLKNQYKAGQDQQVADSFIEFYRSKYPEMYASKKAVIESSAAGLRAIYNRNIFPDMNVTWGTYPNNIGHMDFPGCFRCHDDDHKAANGKTIGQDCSGCHELLATDEKDPKILADFGYSK